LGALVQFLLLQLLDFALQRLDLGAVFGSDAVNLLLLLIRKAELAPVCRKRTLGLRRIFFRVVAEQPAAHKEHCHHHARESAGPGHRSDPLEGMIRGPHWPTLTHCCMNSGENYKKSASPAHFSSSRLPTTDQKHYVEDATGRMAFPSGKQKFGKKSP